MSSPVSPPSDSASGLQGRVIRAALIIFPVGTIVLGIASFGIWWYKREKVEERTYKYAMALRRDLNEASLQRHYDILLEVMAQPPEQKIPAVAAYLESSMGPENMGYQVRRARFEKDGLQLANVDVELMGKKRMQEVVLLLVPYGDAGRNETEARSLAMLMGLAHAVTGEYGTQTLRLAVVPMHASPEALERFFAAAQERRERFMQVIVAGGPTGSDLEKISQAFRVKENGTVLIPLEDTKDIPGTLSAAQAVKARLLKAVE